MTTLPSFPTMKAISSSLFRQISLPMFVSIGLFIWSPLTLGANALPFGLVESFARETRTCHALYRTEAASTGCRNSDVKCPGKIEDIQLDANGFIGVNSYGYTIAHYLAKDEQQEENEKTSDSDPLAARLDEMANTLPEGMAIVFLNRFEGSNHPRLMEMWKVDSANLKSLMSVPIPPTDPKAPFIDRERNAELLKDLLRRGEKLASEWSPLVVYGRSIFLVERECSGLWAGDDFACNRIANLTFKRVEAGAATTFCRLSIQSKQSKESSSKQRSSESKGSGSH